MTRDFAHAPEIICPGNHPKWPPDGGHSTRKSGRRTGPGFHPAIPGQDVLVVLVQGLFNAGEEIQEHEKQDIRHRQPVAANEPPSRDQPIEPGQSLLRGDFQIGGGGRNAMDTISNIFRPSA